MADNFPCWDPGCECPNCAQQEPDIDPAEREYKRLVAEDKIKPLSLGNEPIIVPFTVPLRLWLEAALISVILAWTLINGFWILTHAW